MADTKDTKIKAVKKKSTAKKTKAASKKTAKVKAVKKTAKTKTNKTATKKTPTKKTTAKKTKATKKPTSMSLVEQKNNSEKNVPVEISKPIEIKETKEKKSLFRRKKQNLPDKNKKNLPADTVEIDPDALNRGDEPMSVVDHLDEFRSRILIVLSAVIIFSVVGFYFADYLVQFINQPFKESGHQLNIFKITGGFIIKLKASVVVALLLTVPLIIFQVWRFIRPAIDTEDRTFARISIFASIFLFYGGIAFVFYLLLPFAIKMLLQFITPDMISTIGADDYMSFIFMFSIAMGILFELPIVVLILTKIGLITPRFLITKRKYAVVIIWIIAALITPQDVISQILVAVPLMFLYEVSIVISRFIVIRKAKKELIE